MDFVLRGSIAGIIATIVYISVNWAGYVLKIVPSTVIHYAAILINQPGTKLTAFPLFLGTIANFIAGGMAGVLIAALLKITSNKHLWLKSIGFVVVLWPVHVAFLPAILDKGLYSVLPPVMVLTSLLLVIIWGFTSALVFKYLGNKN